MSGNPIDALRSILEDIAAASGREVDREAIDAARRYCGEAPILDAVTAKVLAYRSVDKGLAAKKTKRKLARKAKADD